jgi:hypothetical protein
MVTDWQEALEAEALPLNPNQGDQLAAAARVAARCARDRRDLWLLLDVLGLHTDADTLTTLLPLLSHSQATAMVGDTVPTEAPNAFTSTAAPMLKDGDKLESVRTTPGLSEEELVEALKHTDPDSAATDLSQALGSEPGSYTGRGDAVRPAPVLQVEALLTWGEQHDTKDVQALAAQARTALAELTQRRETENAIADAEVKVGQLESQLARAREALRTAKNSKPATPAALSNRRTKEQLAAIRTWARANGHQVADDGLPAQVVLDAFDSAQVRISAPRATAL